MNRVKFRYNLCIPVEILIDFIEQNSDFEWNDICDMEYKYRKNGDFENSEAYPIIDLGETDESTMQYWCERFIEEYSSEIGKKTLYILHD
jgi:hypothetical protein